MVTANKNWEVCAEGVTEKVRHLPHLSFNISRGKALPCLSIVDTDVDCLYRTTDSSYSNTSANYLGVIDRAIYYHSPSAPDSCQIFATIILPCVVQSRLSGKLAFHRDNSTKVEDRSRSAGVRPAGGILPWSVFEICDLLLWHFKMQGPFRRRHISFCAINQLLDIYFEPNPLVCLLSLLPFSLRCVLFWSSYFRWLGKLLS